MHGCGQTTAYDFLELFGLGARDSLVFGFVEKLKHLFGAACSHSFYKQSGGEFLFTVDSRNQDAFGIHFQFQPGTSIRNYTSAVNTLGGIFKEKDTRTTV